MNVNTKALATMAELCHVDALEENISLCEDTIDKILESDQWGCAEEKLEYVQAYRLLSKQFQEVLDIIKEDECDGKE